MVGGQARLTLYRYTARSPHIEEEEAAVVPVTQFYSPSQKALLGGMTILVGGQGGYTVRGEDDIRVFDAKLLFEGDKQPKRI